MKKSELKELIEECMQELKESMIHMPEKDQTKFSGRILFNDGDTIVVRPKNFNDMHMVGLGTKWTIARTNTKFFDQYSSHGSIYVISNKSVVPIRKWVLFVPRVSDTMPSEMGEWQMYDHNDNRVNAEQTLDTLKLNKALFQSISRT